jgi:hypothetical protein
MMTNLIVNQQDREHMRHCISDLLLQVAADYQKTQSERRQLATLPTPDEAFTVLEELELLTADIRGYASKVQTRDGLDNPTAMIVHLQTLRLFSVPAIAQIYFETEQYPMLKEYIRRLDYLRLLLLEYLQAHASAHSIK